MCKKKIVTLRQETVFRKTYPGWIQSSSFIRGQERTRSIFLGPVRKPLLWICYYLAIILFWRAQTYCPIDRWHWLMRSHFFSFSCFPHDPLSRSTSRGEFYIRSADRKPDLPHKNCRRHVYATDQVHNHTRQHAKELTWLTAFGLCVSKTCGNCAGNGIPIFAINPDAQRSSQAFNVKIFFSFFFFLLSFFFFALILGHMSSLIPTCLLVHCVVSLLVCLFRPPNTAPVRGHFLATKHSL